MIVIVCVDDANGMLFNHRRQSQDKTLRRQILQIVKQNKLRMNAYSYQQFASEESAVVDIREDFLSSAQPGEYCFVENTDIRPYVAKIEKLILYRWNRLYPSDVKFPLDLSSYQPESRMDFAGTSHDKITQEVYSL